MKKLKKVMAMGLATMAAVSAMSINAMAEEIPAYEEVDTSIASQENPVTYMTEEGIKVTIYDPNISISFSEVDPFIETRANVPSTPIHINAPDAFGNGTKTEDFNAEANKIVKFGLINWVGGPTYNVALYNASDIRQAVAEGINKNMEATLDGTTSAGSYYFRVSTYDQAGNGRYYAYTI